MRHRVRASSLLGPLGLVAAAIGWEVVARVVDREIFVVLFSRVVADLWHWIASGDAAPDLAASGTEFIAGFALAIVAALGIGVPMGLSGTVRRLVGPLVYGLYSTPLLA